MCVNVEGLSCKRALNADELITHLEVLSILYDLSVYVSRSANSDRRPCGLEEHRVRFVFELLFASVLLSRSPPST